LDVANGPNLSDAFAGIEAPLDRGADALFLIQRGNDHAQHRRLSGASRLPSR
jgi:hypothetical protein